MRINQEAIDLLKQIKWWDFEPEYLVMALPFIESPGKENASAELLRIAGLDLEAKSRGF